MFLLGLEKALKDQHIKEKYEKLADFINKHSPELADLSLWGALCSLTVTYAEAKKLEKELSEKDKCISDLRGEIESRKAT